METGQSETGAVAPPAIEPQPADPIAACWDWDALDRELRPRLIGFGRRRLGLSREEAEDVFQSVLLNAATLSPRVRDPIAYLKAAYRNGAINLLRRRGRRPETEMPEDVTDPGGLSAVEAWASRVTVRRAWFLVDERCRQLLKARFVDERKLRETAVAIGLGKNNVWKRIARCLERMRTCLSTPAPKRS